MATIKRIALFCSVLLLAGGLHADQPQLLTAAEKTGYKATSRHSEVVAFCEALAKSAPATVRLTDMGKSTEGRSLPLLILANPPVATPEAAAASGKIVVLAIGNIHAGEVDGKEGLLMLARDLATAKDRPLLKDLIFIVAPIFNADGNEKMSKTNRPGQAGPDDGAGRRENAQGYDLNRDFVKLESPEVRALVRLFNKCNAHIFVDCHTTNGSHHRYNITYEGPRILAGDNRIIDFARDEMFPDLSKRLEKRNGTPSFYYGFMSRDRARWETVPATARYGTLYYGLRNRIGILSESYTYAPFKDRVLASRDFVWSILDFAAANKDKIKKLLDQARDETVAAGKSPKATDKVVLRHKLAPQGRPVGILGFEEVTKDGRTVATDKPKTYEVQYIGKPEATLSVTRPAAYIFPKSYAAVVELLQRHGLEVEELREDIELDLEVYCTDKITLAQNPFQKHQNASVEATPRKESRRVAAGSILVRTSQPLGSLAAYLLEPQSEDGLTTWNFFDASLKEGQDFPVVRLLNPVALTATRVRRLPEDRVLNKTPGAGVNVSGDPITVTWLDDDHLLQTKSGKRYKVHALTGRMEPYEGKESPVPPPSLGQRPRRQGNAAASSTTVSPDQEKLRTALAALPDIPKDQIDGIAGGRYTANPTGAGGYFTIANDLYFVYFDGSKAVRLTKSPGQKELFSFSPDGKFLAFVNANNLFLVDIATAAVHQLTKDGSPQIFNGKADWVYYEEIFNRNYKAYWWSPDSTHLAFLRIDDTPVRKFVVLDHIPTRLKVEETPYPKAGDPNPTVKLGIASVSGNTHFVPLPGHTDADTLIPRAGFVPGKPTVYFYVQDRAQTWLDFCVAPADGGEPTKLYHETTGAYVEEEQIGPPTFLKDGSFLFHSERSGWKHFYRYDQSGKLLNAVSTGPWEARSIAKLDEDSGWLYISGTTPSNHTGTSFWRVRLDGSGQQCLTPGPGDHRVALSPNNKLFVDAWSNYKTPKQSRLYHIDGTPARTLDANPVYALEEYNWGKYEMVQIPTPDGFLLEGSVVLPPHYDPNKKFPVWFKTYGGPHAPTIHDGWAGRLGDQTLAAQGYIVFGCDPHSASAKGACSVWTAYRQMGVQEMKDIDTAINWLIKKYPGVDAKRIGMSGHSYGGFMTSYCLTHSKLFACGIAGAPVTDWKNYDSVYTERYMDTPQKNPDGYKKTSVVAAAKNIHGKLLLLHGIMDDNVHMANTVQLMGALQQADMDFEVMFYPQARHGIIGSHYTRLMREFMKRELKPEPMGQATSKGT